MWQAGGRSSSRCAGLSLSRPLLLRSTGSRRAGSVAVAHGPSCSAACGIFPDQGSNPCPLHWQADSQPLRHQGSPSLLFIGEDTEAQRVQVLCPRLRPEYLAQLGFKHRNRLTPKLEFFSCLSPSIFKWRLLHPALFLPSLLYLFFHSSYSLLAHPTLGLLEYQLHVTRAFCFVY